MASQATSESKLRFLSAEFHPIDQLSEWKDAFAEVQVDYQNWIHYQVRLNGRLLEAGLRRTPLGPDPRVIASIPRLGTGNYRLELEKSDGASSWRTIECAPFTIVPSKLPGGSFERLLEDLELHLPASVALSLQRHGALTRIRILPPESSTRAQERLRLERAVDGAQEPFRRRGLAELLPRIAIDPYKRLRSSRAWTRRERARRIDPTRFWEAMIRPGNLSAERVPTQVPELVVEHTFDVYENRLIENYVREVSRRTTRLRRATDPTAREHNPVGLALEGMTLRMRRARREAAFLSDVYPHPVGSVHSTKVLEARPPYREAFRGLQELRRSLRAELDCRALAAPLEEVPSLYETWGVLWVILSLMDYCSAPRFEVLQNRLVALTADGLYVRVLPDGLAAIELRENTSGTVIKAIPQRSYFRTPPLKSMSREQIPDLAIEVYPQGGQPRVLVFDPKYKLDSEDAEAGRGSAKTADINKMHTYRDAIVDEAEDHVVRYAAILYPGPDETFADGLEAISALPTLERDARDVPKPPVFMERLVGVWKKHLLPPDFPTTSGTTQA